MSDWKILSASGRLLECGLTEAEARALCGPPGSSEVRYVLDFVGHTTHTVYVW